MEGKKITRCERILNVGERLNENPQIILTETYEKKWKMQLKCNFIDYLLMHGLDKLS